MNPSPPGAPPKLEAIAAANRALDFTMCSDKESGAMLATLAASKPGGRFLELGTGTGYGTAWLLAGMDSVSRLDTVDISERYVAVARRHLGADPRVTFHLQDGGQFLNAQPASHYDFIFADAVPGKYSHLAKALSLLRPGGLYFVDDLDPQPGWSAEHTSRVPLLVAALQENAQLATVRLAWSTGLMLAVRNSDG